MSKVAPAKNIEDKLGLFFLGVWFGCGLAVLVMSVYLFPQDFRRTKEGLQHFDETIYGISIVVGWPLKLFSTLVHLIIKFV